MLTEHGDLRRPGTLIWSYTGVVYMTTLGWKFRRYSRGVSVAVLHLDGSVKWLRKSVIKPVQKYNRKADSWHTRWQITP